MDPLLAGMGNLNMGGYADEQEQEGGAAPELTRRQREEIEAEKKKRHYEKLQAAGKTDEAKADLERLTKIKAEREEARKKREEEEEKKTGPKSKAVNSKEV